MMAAIRIIAIPLRDCLQTTKERDLVGRGCCCQRGELAMKSAVGVFPGFLLLLPVVPALLSPSSSRRSWARAASQSTRSFSASSLPSRTRAASYWSGCWLPSAPRGSAHSGSIRYQIHPVGVMGSPAVAVPAGVLGMGVIAMLAAIMRV
jgi:hypothetical protein